MLSVMPGNLIGWTVWGTKWKISYIGAFAMPLIDFFHSLQKAFINILCQSFLAVIRLMSLKKVHTSQKREKEERNTVT